MDIPGWRKAETLRSAAIMGIVNATGDSFSEGGRSSAASAVARAAALLEDGADILDIGGESTRPGAAEVFWREECARVLPVVKEMKKLFPDCVISVDTRHAEVARAVLDEGAGIINDVSMLRRSPEMAETVAGYGAALVLNHSRGTPEDMQKEEYCTYPGGVVREVAAELAAAESIALEAGVKKENIILDPGIGFSKTPEQCWEILRSVCDIASAERLLVGVSRKSFLGVLCGEKIAERRLGCTLAVELELAARNIGIIRTHAVRELKNAVKAMKYFRGL